MPLNVATDERRRLTGALLDELTAWNPRERIGAFRAWMRGSLSLIHLLVLTVLESEGPLSMRKLAEALDVSVASATGIVDRMADRGLVEREQSPTDRRVVLVHATTAGRAVFVDLGAVRREHLERVLARLSDRELASFLAGLRGMRRARAELEHEREAADLPVTRTDA